MKTGAGLFPNFADQIHHFQFLVGGNFTGFQLNTAHSAC
jgi:hypothetical protein